MKNKWKNVKNFRCHDLPTHTVIVMKLTKYLLTYIVDKSEAAHEYNFYLKLLGLHQMYMFHNYNITVDITAGQKIKISQGKKTREIKYKSKIFFREIAFLAVLNFFPVQKLIFSHF